MRVVGITGRSGCGKSTVTRYIAGQGYPCCDADQIAREVLMPGSPCIQQLKDAFGDDMMDAQGNVNRRALADRAFATPEGTKTLTEITWPEIISRIDVCIDTARKAQEKLFFVDGAVIVGTPFEARCDALVLVVAPLETSIARICKRDGIEPAMAERRLQAQLPEQVLRTAAKFVLENDGTEQQLLEQCGRLLCRLQKEENGGKSK